MNRPQPADHFRFKLPFEHGAWWTYFSCLAAGLEVGSREGLTMASAIPLAMALAGPFLASDWLFGVFSSVTSRRKGRSNWRAWQGWLVIGLSLGFLGIFWMGTAAAQRAALVPLFVGLTAAALGLLWLRGSLPPRHPILLSLSAVVLSLPLLVFILAVRPGSASLPARLWLPVAAFFVAGVFHVQAWIRGASLPLLRRILAPLLYALLALGDGLGGRTWCSLGFGLILLRCLWLLLFPPRRDSPFPPPHQIRKFGFEQVGWSGLVLALRLAASL